MENLVAQIRVERHFIPIRGGHARREFETNVPNFDHVDFGSKLII